MSAHVTYLSVLERELFENLELLYEMKRGEFLIDLKAFELQRPKVFEMYNLPLYIVSSVPLFLSTLTGVSSKNYGGRGAAADA
jgi:hypothetical protein